MKPQNTYQPKFGVRPLAPMPLSMTLKNTKEKARLMTKPVQPLVGWLSVVFLKRFGMVPQIRPLKSAMAMAA